MTGVDIFMPWYFMDYLRDTADLTAEEHGAYLLLLGHMWNRGGELPNHPGRLSRLAAVDEDRWPAVWSAISRFFTFYNGMITQSRLSHELAKASEKKRLASAAGRASAEARSQQNSNGNPNAGHNGTATETLTDRQRRGEQNANPSPSPTEPHTQSDPPSSEVVVPRAQAREASAVDPPDPPPTTTADAPDDQAARASIAEALADAAFGLPLAELSRPRRQEVTRAASWCHGRGIEEGEIPDLVRGWYELIRRRKGGVPMARVDPPTVGQLTAHFAQVLRREEEGVAGSLRRAPSLPEPEPRPEPVETEAEHIWSDAAQNLRGHMINSLWEELIHPTQAVLLEGAVLTVRAPSVFAKERIVHHMLPLVQEYVRDAAGRELEVRVVAGGAS